MAWQEVQPKASKKAAAQPLASFKTKLRFNAVATKKYGLDKPDTYVSVYFDIEQNALSVVINPRGPFKINLEGGEGARIDTTLLRKESGFTAKVGNIPVGCSDNGALILILSKGIINEKA